jgi:hypothetical protein
MEALGHVRGHDNVQRALSDRAFKDLEFGNFALALRLGLRPVGSRAFKGARMMGRDFAGRCAALAQVLWLLSASVGLWHPLSRVILRPSRRERNREH